MSPRSHDWHAWLGLSTIVVVAVAGVFWLARSADDSRDSSLRPISSRITGTGLYVDDALCAECHSQQAETFRQTGHADTFRFTTQSSQAARLDGETFADPERDYTPG
jgi:cbb3-type cytochrome oxidase cytochrome c subunit